MPNRGDRGGAQTRARISDIATRLFLERGFDDVTVAEVAAAAGVSKVTVFSHFERKEDLLLDRLPDAVDLAVRAVRERSGDVVPAFHAAAAELAAHRHPLSGLGGDIEPIIRTVNNSPALIARLRMFESEIERAVGRALVADERFTGNAALVAALLLAAYRVVMTETVRRRLSGENLDAVAAGHEERLKEAFDSIRA